MDQLNYFFLTLFYPQIQYLIPILNHYKKKDVLEWSKTNTWLKLEVVQAEGAIVEFKAYYIDETLQAQVHHEKSTFKQEKGIWYYVDGKFY